MRLYLLLFVLSVLIISCNALPDSHALHPVQSIRKSILWKDSISIRAIEVSAEKVWFAGSLSTIGVVDIERKASKIVHLKTEKPTEFRSIARNNQHIFMMSIANPAQLFRGSLQLDLIDAIYSEVHEKVFYDALAFIDSKNGIAIGDPTVASLAVLLTHDGGQTWKRIPENDAPQLAPGEAAFAASNSNIVVQGQTLWVITGGKKSRLWQSNDLGYHWKSIEIPIVQGGEMTGAFTAAFYDAAIGVIAGGDYSNPLNSDGNCVLTRNGGKQWERIECNQGPSYISCIQFIPGSKGMEWITVGSRGVFYTYNQGKNWIQLDSDYQLYTLRFMDSNSFIAAGKNKIVHYKLIR